MDHIKAAEVLDAYRVVPRMVLLGYAYLVYDIVTWFKDLEDPATQQAALVTTVIGASAAVIGLYNNSGRKYEKGNRDE